MDRPSTPWIPVLEQTDFNYLESAVLEATKAVEDALNTTSADAKDKSKEALESAMRSLFKLKLYYVPITKVRQLIYDADRFFYLGQNDQTKKHLAEANEILTHIAESNIYNLETPVNKLILMIDDLGLLLNESSPNVNEAFKNVGHRVNMMLVKGQLVMSGQDFVKKKE